MTLRAVNRRSFLKCAAGALAGSVLPWRGLLAAPAGTAPGGKDRPNIVMILVDDLGCGDLSSYGAKDLRTPNIDALVAGGMSFGRFYASRPVCSPTRAALLTRRYPAMVGVPGVIRTRDSANWGYLSPSARTLGELLKPAGYDTALIGKWHLGLESPNLPNERGFDLFEGFLGDMMESCTTHRRDAQAKTVRPAQGRTRQVRQGRRGRRVAQTKPAEQLGGNGAGNFFILPVRSGQKRFLTPFPRSLLSSAPHGREKGDNVPRREHSIQRRVLPVHQRERDFLLGYFQLPYQVAQAGSFGQVHRGPVEPALPENREQSHFNPHLKALRAENSKFEAPNNKQISNNKLQIPNGH
jgi:hypothetical protein